MLWFLAILILCFYSLGKKNPWKWFKDTRMKVPGDGDSNSDKAEPLVVAQGKTDPKSSILLNLAILFGGVLLAVWGLSGLFTMNNDAIYIFTRVALQISLVVAVLGIGFAKSWINVKRTAIVTAILSAGLGLWVYSLWSQSPAHHANVAPSTTPFQSVETEPNSTRQIEAPTIFLDDISYVKDGSEFSSAFVQEPACSGLSLMTWTNHTDEERMLGLRRSEWKLSYATMLGSHGGTVYHRHPGTIAGEPDRFDFNVGFQADTPEGAARKVCSIIKSRGGKLR